MFIIVTTPGALLANVSKGYLAPLALTLVIVICSNLFATKGICKYSFNSNTVLNFKEVAILSQSNRSLFGYNNLYSVYISGIS